MANKKIDVVELFAGVGGFRLGLEGWHEMSSSSGYTEPYDSPFRVVWSNQYEPSTKVQHASRVYEHRFPETSKSRHENQDIFPFPVENIPDHQMLVGGFPCQDYSVARTLNQAEGLVGKKGVLWWAIHNIVKKKAKKRPDILFLENVDRLINSPAKQRGRDFAIILASLAEQGYIVEWRIINAADYGMPQRRRRAFILAYRKDSQIGKQFLRLRKSVDWILDEGVFAKAFPIHVTEPPLLPFELPNDLELISRNFPALLLGEELDAKPQLGEKSPFQNAGVMIDSQVFTVRTTPVREPEKHLDDIIYKNGKLAIDDSFYLTPESLPVWETLKGAKPNNLRRSKSGFVYNYNEGAVAFPDPLNRPSRTIITGEGGPTPSRFKHVVETSKGLRRLVPEELEKLNMFPPGHTKLEGISDVKRAFFMGNALVVGVVERTARELARRIR